MFKHCYLVNGAATLCSSFARGHIRTSMRGKLPFPNGGCSVCPSPRKYALYIFEWVFRHRLVKRIFVQMVEAVEYIHSMGVCHLDLSLENFLIDDVPINLHEVDGKQTVRFDVDQVQIRVIDFGLAMRFENGSSFESTKFAGKPNYQSPEVTANRPFHAKSNDVFCLGYGRGLDLKPHALCSLYTHPPLLFVHETVLTVFCPLCSASVYSVC